MASRSRSVLGSRPTLSLPADDAVARWPCRGSRRAAPRSTAACPGRWRRPRRGSWSAPSSRHRGTPFCLARRSHSAQSSAATALPMAAPGPALEHEALHELMEPADRARLLADQLLRESVHHRLRRWRGDRDPDGLLVRVQEDRDLGDARRPVRELHIPDRPAGRILVEDRPNARDAQRELLSCRVGSVRAHPRLVRSHGCARPRPGCAAEGCEEDTLSAGCELRLRNEATSISRAWASVSACSGVFCPSMRRLDLLVHDLVVADRPRAWRD